MAETEVTSVTCNHCGGPLPIQPDTRFVICTYCGARLEVRRSGNALYTQVLESIDQRTQRIEKDVEAIRRETEVERLDREWQMRREQYVPRDRNGNPREPGPGGGIAMLLASLLVGAFGIFWTVSLLDHGGPPGMAVFGIVFTLAAIGGGIFAMVRSLAYRDAEQAYLRQRARLTQSTDPSSQKP